MDVFDLDRSVVADYERFSRSFSAIKADDLKRGIDAIYAGRRFWLEPLLQLNPHYAPGGSIGDLVRERLREKAIRNLSAIHDASIDVPHATEVISSIWVRSLSTAQDAGAIRNEVQLDITRHKPVDDNAFTAELAKIVENSFNIHEIGTHDRRFCFKLPENPESKLKAWASREPQSDMRDRRKLRDLIVLCRKRTSESISS